MKLSTLETEMLELTANGMEYRDVAKELQRSRDYVKRRMCELFSKMGADNKTQAVAMAMRRGLIK